MYCYLMLISIRTLNVTSLADGPFSPLSFLSFPISTILEDFPCQAPGRVVVRKPLCARRCHCAGKRVCVCVCVCAAARASAWDGRKWGRGEQGGLFSAIDLQERFKSPFLFSFADSTTTH